MTKTAASGFDVKTLAQLGYNEDIAEFFKTARFLPGVHRVMLEVNAAQRYQEEVRFDSQGALCLDEQLAQTLRLRVTPPPGACERFDSHWPQAVVQVFPGAFGWKSPCRRWRSMRTNCAASSRAAMRFC